MLYFLWNGLLTVYNWAGVVQLFCWTKNTDLCGTEKDSGYSLRNRYKIRDFWW